MSRRPAIGVTKDASAQPAQPQADFYATSVERAGGTPLPIYYRDDLTAIDAVLDGLDGILFSGGDDLDPALYGQAWHPMAKAVDARRQRWELALLAAAEARARARARGMPILGICLGCQLINVHRGGSLIQFLPDVPRPGALEHRKVNGVLVRHDVTIEADSILGRAIGKTVVNVNTYHKQAVDRPGRGLRVTARATDGVIEGIEDASMPLLVGVQWHPERISAEAEHLAIFEMLVRAAQT